MTGLPVVLYGLGPIGCRLGRRLLRMTGVHVVGAVDIDPAKVGRPLESVLELETSTSVVVTDDPAAALGDGDGIGVVVHATASRLAVVAPQLMTIVRAGWNVVSTCEELVYPSIVDASVADGLHREARRLGVTVLGSGINPGFLLDSLVLVLTGACTRVESVSVRRVVDTDRRRVPLQHKAGVGISAEEFADRAARGAIGHVGLSQSAHLVADRLGWPVAGYSETIEPVLADRDTTTGLGSVPAGRVLGQHQTAVLCSGGREVVRYTQIMAAGQPSLDVIEITGEPSIVQRIDGGLNGDVGTEAVVTNLVPTVSAARPGLLTMADVLPLSCAPPA